MVDADSGRDAFEEAIAELNNCVCGAFGLGSLLAHRHAPEFVESLSRDLDRYRRLVADLRKAHSEGRLG